MALTHHLTVIKDSPVKAFLLDHLPNTRQLVSAHNKRLADAATVPLSDRVHAATIGTAIDYRIRYYFGSARSQGATVAEQGAARLTQEGHLSQASVSRFFAALDALTASLPIGVGLSDPDEDLLCRHCLVLANLESAFRAGPHVTEGTPLLQKRDPTVDDLLAVHGEEAVADMAAQSRLFLETADDRLTGPHVLNPTFDGSADVGGADADLILDATLIDIKSTIAPKLSRSWLWQIICYCMLDYTDEYRLTACGIYLSRQGIFLEWPLAELVESISTGIRWPTVREAFRDMLLRMRP